MSKSIAHSRRGIVIGVFHFTPGLLPTVATVLVFALLMNLGFWQLRRAEFKEGMVERLESRSQQSSRDINALTQDDITGDMTDYPLHVTGHYLNDLSLLLDNRPYHGQPGYEVLTAFLTNGQVLLVNRGWIAQGPDRRVPPAIPQVKGEITLHGNAHTPNPDFFVLKEDDYSQVNWPFLIQKIDLEKSAQLFDYPVMPFVLRLEPDESSQFVREWHSHFMGPEKHYGYAVQWFSLAAALLVIYVVVNTKRKQ
ncbi:MAG: cytochrome oxidase biogenesis protein Surf1,facilitates heme A insertion [Pseudomonadales bacterium]|nr:cytochrome oxidase biogenesis protein Surf1,facilitates heme A insertion [Pseudomonadales bacterium]